MNTLALNFRSGWSRVLLAALVFGTQAAAAAAGPEALALRDPSAAVSVTAAGESGGARLSPGGRFLLFVSNADDLVTNVHNGPVTDLFVRNQETGEVSLVSVTPDGRQGGDGNTYQGAVSEDGRWVAFESEAKNLVAEETTPDGVGFFLRDRVSGITRRIGLPRLPNALLAVGAPMEAPLAMDPGGMRIAMVHGGLLYVYDRNADVCTNLIRPLSNPPMTPAGYRSSSPQFDATGRLLAFGCNVPNLVRPTTGPVRGLQLYLFRFDRGNFDPTNLTQLRLTNAQLPSVAGGIPVGDHSLSRDGEILTVAVPPGATPTAALGVFRFNLVSGEVRQLTAGMQINRGATLALATFDPYPTGLADPVRRVAFELVQGLPATSIYTNGLFVWESDGSTEHLQRLLINASLPAKALTGTPLDFTGDGRRLLISTIDTNVVSAVTGVRLRYALVDVSTGGRTLAVDDDAEARAVLLSGPGGGVIFESTLPHLATPDLNRAGDLFHQPADGGEPTLLSRRVETVVPRAGDGLSALGDGAFSADGERWVFTSVAGDLVPDDLNSAEDVFARDRADGRLRLVSVNRDGSGPGNGPSGHPAISGDGRFVAFVSGATNLVADDTNDRPDLFVRDLRDGVMSLISSSPGGTVTEFAMSRNARRFLWIRRDAALLRVQYRDLDGGEVRTLVSSSKCASPVLSTDGSVGMFVGGSAVLMFTPGSEAAPVRVAVPENVERIVMSPDGSQVALFAPRHGPIVRVRMPDGTYSVPAVNFDHGEAWFKEGVFSPDSRWLAYAAIPGPFPPQSKGGNLGYRVFLLDLQTGDRLRIGGDLGVFDGPVDGDSDRPAFSPDGRLVAFRTAAGNLVADDDNRSDDLAIYDRLTGQIRLISRDADSADPWAARSWRGRFGSRSDELWVGTFSADVIPGDFNGAAEFVRLPLPVDADHDGMEDTLEQDAFKNSEQTGAGDADLDGVSNAEELVMGTDPNLPESVLRLRVEEAAPGNSVAVWPSVPGRRYRVLTAYSTFGPWQHWGPVVTATGTQTELALPSFPSDKEFYVRLVLAE